MCVCMCAPERERESERERERYVDRGPGACLSQRGLILGYSHAFRLVAGTSSCFDAQQPDKRLHVPGRLFDASHAVACLIRTMQKYEGGHRSGFLKRELQPGLDYGSHDSYLADADLGASSFQPD